METVYPIIALYASAALFCAVIFCADPNLRAWVLKGPIDDATAAMDGDAERGPQEQAR
jgi:hypothetical protein